LKPDTPLASAVEQVAYTLENLNVKIVMKIDFHYNKVVTALKQTTINSRVNISFQTIATNNLLFSFQ
jgi:hypothetical protein